MPELAEWPVMERVRERMVEQPVVVPEVVVEVALETSSLEQAVNSGCCGRGYPSVGAGETDDRQAVTRRRQGGGEQSRLI